MLGGMGSRHSLVGRQLGRNPKSGSDQFQGYASRVPHVALLGPPTLLDLCAPSDVDDLTVTRVDDLPMNGASTDALVAFEPSEDQWAKLDEVQLPTLIWWQDGPPAWVDTQYRSGSSEPRRTVVGSPEAATGSWRSVPLPVADALFSDWSQQAPAAGTAAVNFQDESGPASLHRALVALAQGQVLVSEPLQPSRGLEPGIDYLEAHDLDEVRAAVENVARAPEAFLRMRLRGRRKAELFRSSSVITRLIGDLLLELDLAAAAR